MTDFQTRKQEILKQLASAVSDTWHWQQEINDADKLLDQLYLDELLKYKKRGLINYVGVTKTPIEAVPVAAIKQLLQPEATYKPTDYYADGSGV